MDILKVLSRGLKQPNGSKQAKGNNNFLPAGAATLPSAGSSINPQLYHDRMASLIAGNNGSKKNRKRKRNGDSTNDSDDSQSGSDSDESDGSDDLNELDFFGERSAVATTTADNASSDAKDAKDTKKAKKAKKQKRDPADDLLDEDECRQILRSHRLKLTLLTDRRAAAEAAAEAAAAAVVEKLEKKKKKKSEKKAKRAEEEAAAAASKAAKDEAKKQFFSQPLTAFAQLRQTYNLSARLADNLERLLYRIPTEVQMASLPLLLDPALALSKTTLPGDAAAVATSTTAVDFMAVAPTGSGKTLSFLVPAINGILKRRAEEKEKAGGDKTEDEASGGHQKHDHVLDTIVVAPTRELAHQIANEGKKLTVGTGVRVVAMSKGMRVQADDGEEEGEEASDSEEEKDEEEDGEDDKSKPSKKATVTRADILVTTPLMLLNSLSRRALPTVRSLILDEADVLLDPLFREQTLGIWTACTHSNLRATFWSATMASNIEELVVEQLAARQTEEEQKRLLVRLVVGLKDTAVPNVTHRLVYTATEQGKLLAMRQLLHPSTSTSVTGTSGGESEALRPPFLVFTQTAERATALHDELKYDIPAAAGGADRLGVLHAALADTARSAVVRKFRAGQVWVLITTDVLARGIDFAGVNGVVNYDVPGSAAAYVHRAGRTGRAGRQGGLSVTLYTKEDIPFVKSVANVIAASEKQAAKSGGSSAATEGKGIQQWLLDALPEVTKADKKRLKTRGVESRRSTTTAGAAEKAKGKGKNHKGKSAGSRDSKETIPNAKARITSKSAWERRRDNNRRDAIASSKQRKQQGEKDGGSDDGEWRGLD
ncbi:RNA-dependent ATPase rok1 [Sporothrix stenoceras]|uniref:ATP-dependent RNA helicase ROK1 n=1 Tax=Sporothrix stenoceras TaxID=5173 RepID=A0ABR3ZD24_9PEZI